MKRLSLLIILCSFFSCSKTPQPINYGTDMCHFCQMTIVTKTHAAQMVTTKGKQYKFDAIGATSSQLFSNFLDLPSIILPVQYARMAAL